MSAKAKNVFVFTSAASTYFRSC